MFQESFVTFVLMSHDISSSWDRRFDAPTEALSCCVARNASDNAT